MLDYSVSININLTNLSTVNLTVIQNIIKTYSLTKIKYFSITLNPTNIISSSLFDEIDDLCRQYNKNWFLIVSTIAEIDLTRKYYSNLPNGKIGYMLGINPKQITNFNLLTYAQESSDFLVLYTSLSTQVQIDRAIEISQPDIIVHHSYGESKLDYIKYLQGISIEFDKKYLIGFMNNHLDSKVKLVSAYLFGANFLEQCIELDDELANFYLATGVSNDIEELLSNLEIINLSRGGYEARKLTKIEKELNKK
jgi:hypothetical protein